MGKEKIKIQLVDADGDKYNLSLEGWSKTKVVSEMNVTISSELLFCDSFFTQLDGYSIVIP